MDSVLLFQVLLGLMLVESLDHLLESLLLDLLRDIISVVSRCMCFGSHRVHVQKRHFILELLQSRDGLSQIHPYVLKLLICLSTESSYHVSGECDLGDLRSDPFYEVAIRVHCIVPSHSIQDSVASTLERHVDVFADVGVFCHYLDDLFREVFRVWRCESEANLREFRCSFLQQLGESRARSISEFEHLPEVLRVVMLIFFSACSIVITVHVLTQECDLLHPLACQLLDLIHNTCDWATSFPTSHKRYDTK